MTDQPTDWPFMLGALIRLLPTFLTWVKSHRRIKRRRVRFSHWKGFGIERTRFDMTDDSQS
jgi:hypothetical protein